MQACLSIMDGFDTRFQVPSNLLAVGPTSCGKTTWLARLVENRDHFFSAKPKSLFIFYKEWQKQYENMRKTMAADAKGFKTFFKYASVPDSIEEIKDILEQVPRNEPKMVVFDDYLDDINSVMTHFFTVLTHHYNCFTVFLCQNLFNAKNELRTLSINTQYMVLFNNPRDKSAVAHLSKQIFPGRNNTLNKAYQMATMEKPYGYLLLDFHQKQRDKIRLRSHIFPHEKPMRTYISSSII